MSMKLALERLLGGPCYHMIEVLRTPGHVQFWARKGRGERVDYEEVLGDYVAAVDWPTTRYYDELVELNPEAKVVLTTRDPQRWYESTRETIFKIWEQFDRPPVSWMAQQMPRTRAMRPMMEDVIWGDRGHFGGRFEDRAHAIEVYEAHIEEVKRRIPADRLLVYELKQGWAPLCEFLEVPVPNEPLPHVNDRDEMLGRLRTMKRVAWLTAPVTLPLSLLRS